MARTMTSVPGDGTSSVRTAVPTASARVASAPLVAMAIAAGLGITWTVGLRQGFLFVVGIGLGAVLAGVSFGFTTGWRAWIRDRDPTGLLAQFLAIGLAMVVSIPLIASHSELSGAIGPLSVSLVIGAFVFGAAMQIADGCGSGTLYKAGLGNGFSLAVLPGFIVGSFFGAAHLDAWMALGSLPPVSLPETLGTVPALVLQVAAFAILAAFLWNKRGKRTDTRWKGRAVYVGAVFMALFAVLNLLVAGQPWGVVYGLGLWGAKVATWLGADLTANAFWSREAQQAQIHASLLTDITSVTNLGLLMGALITANLRGTACPATRATPKQWLAAVVAGLLLGYSSRLAFGCNVGAYFSGISTGSVHGWVWFAMAFLGSLLGVRARERLGLKA
jgi:uncharacterized membrane protein YedE/YeeE